MELSSVVQYKSVAEIENLREETAECDMWRFKVADPDIKRKVVSAEWANAIVQLLLDGYRTDPVPIIQVVTDTPTSLMASLRAEFDITRNAKDYVLCTDVFDLFPDKKKVTIELEALRVTKKKMASGADRGKWVFIGMCIRKPEVAAVI